VVVKWFVVQREALSSAQLAVRLRAMPELARLQVPHGWVSGRNAKNGQSEGARTTAGTAAKL
jgi:hypothetical protein